MSEQGKPDKWFVSEATDREDNILVLDKVGLVAAVTTEDDAHLIVAAPELLDALKKCAAALLNIVGDDAIRQTTVINAWAQAVEAEAAARCAISKAAGD